MAVAEEFTFFPESRPAAMVVSHERSGTHFLMNALAACHGYVSLPWINFDMPTANVLDHLSRQEVRDVLLSMTGRPMANVVKLHHPVDFFTGELEALLERYVIFVIHRDPVAVMLSFWRFMHHFEPSDNAGPQVADPLTFARAMPFGRMLRYQTQSYPSVLHRWAGHVQGWLAAARQFPRIQIVRYEDLDGSYEATMQSFSTVLGRPPRALVRPARDFNVVRCGPADPMGTGIPPDVEALRRLCRETVGETMEQLGY